MAVADMIERFKNPDGTYDGVAALAALTGRDEREVAWAARRLKQMMQVEGKSRVAALQQLTLEAKETPWLVL